MIRSMKKMMKKTVYKRGGHLYYKPSANGNNLVGGRNDQRLMFRNSLWLTSGGRIVKPGPGEYAGSEFNDIELIGREEIENGISCKDFRRRLDRAMKQWECRERRIKRQLRKMSCH